MLQNINILIWSYSYCVRYSLSKITCFAGNSMPKKTLNMPPVVMSGLMLLVATRNSWISYKNGYAGLLVLQLLPLLNPWFIVEM